MPLYMRVHLYQFSQLLTFENLKKIKIFHHQDSVYYTRKSVMSKLLCNAFVLFSALLAVALLIATFGHSDAMPMPAKMSYPFSEKPSAKKFWSPSTSGEFSGQEWTPQGSPMLIPYASGNGFISPLSSGLYDRSAVYLADEQQYMPNNKRGTGEGSFMDPSGGAGWLSLREPGRLEWNFNRLR